MEYQVNGRNYDTLTDGTKAILEALADTEAVLYYAKNRNPHSAYVEAMQKQLHEFIKTWHDLTGATLD